MLGSDGRGTTTDGVWSAAGEGETGLVGVIVGATAGWVFELSIGVGVDVLAD